MPEIERFDTLVIGSGEAGEIHVPGRVENAQLPRTPFERSRWRGGRFACYAPDVMPQGRAFNCDSRFSLIFLSHAKSIGCRREKIQSP